MKRTAIPLCLRADVLEWRPTHFSMTMPSPVASWFSPVEGYWHPNCEAELVIETCATGSIKDASRVILREAQATEKNFLLALLRDAVLHRFRDPFIVTVQCSGSTVASGARTVRRRVFGAVGLVLSWTHVFRLFLVFPTEQEAAEWYAAIQRFLALRQHMKKDRNIDLTLSEADTTHAMGCENEGIPMEVPRKDMAFRTEPPCKGVLIIRNPSGSFNKWYVIPSKYLVHTTECQRKPSRQVVYFSFFRSRLLLQFQKLIGIYPIRRIDLRYTIVSDEKVSDTVFFLHYNPFHSDFYRVAQSGRRSQSMQPRCYECVVTSVEDKLQWQRWFTSCGAKLLRDFDAFAKPSPVADMCPEEPPPFSSSVRATASMAPGQSPISAITVSGTARAESSRDLSQCRTSSSEVPLSGMRWCAEKTDRSGHLSRSVEASSNTHSTRPPSCQNTGSCTYTNSPIEQALPESSLGVRHRFELDSDAELSCAVRNEVLVKRGDPVTLRDIFDPCAYDGSSREALCGVSPPLPCREVEDCVALRGCAADELNRCSASPERGPPVPPPREAPNCLADTNLLESQIPTENDDYLQKPEEKRSENVIASGRDTLRHMLDEILEPLKEGTIED